MIRGLITLTALLVVLSIPSAAQGTWQEYRSTDGRFGVTMPCTPKFESVAVSNAGKPGVSRQFVCKAADNIVYLGAYSDYQPGFDKRAELLRNRDGFVAGFHPNGTGVVVSERSIYSGDGIEFWTRGKEKDGTFTASVVRFFFVGNRLYSIGLAKNESVTRTPFQNAALFSSFYLISNERQVAKR